MDNAFYVHKLSRYLWNGPTYSISYYQLFALLSLLIGAALFWWQIRRAKYPHKYLLISFPLVPAVTVIACRISDCLFYNTEYFFKNPIEMLSHWDAGYSSHGALVALPLYFIVFSYITKKPVLDLFDRFTFSTLLSASLVRLGNFFNSEICGKPTDLPWGIRYMRFDGGFQIRHPTQIYEFLFGMGILLMLFIVDWLAGKEKRPRGLIFGIGVTSYLICRFLVEFLKESLVFKDGESVLTMGQWLCIPGLIMGFSVLAWVVIRERSKRAKG